MMQVEQCVPFNDLHSKGVKAHKPNNKTCLHNDERIQFPVPDEILSSGWRNTKLNDKSKKAMFKTKEEIVGKQIGYREKPHSNETKQIWLKRADKGR